MRGVRLIWLVAALVVVVRAEGADPQKWVGTWAASQQVPEPQNALLSADLRDATLRQTVHVSVGGSSVRVHLSNAFGTRDLHVISVHIARPTASGASAINPASDRVLLFNGSADVIIPPAAEYVSDPLAYPLAGLSDLTISVRIETAPGQQTGHPGSRQTTFFAHGDLTGAQEMAGAKKVDHWYFISGVDVSASSHGYSVVALGDSITDGHATTTNGNDRWPDVLAQRLQRDKGTREVGVLNQGIGGNHLLTDGLGPNVLARLDRDVVAQPGVRYVVVLEGINDLGFVSRLDHPTQAQHDLLVHRMIGAYEQIVARAHSHGLKVYGATVLPDGGSDYYHPDAASERDRQQVNAWIRGAGHFDAVIDLDKTMADPSNPQRLLPAFDSGDHLHPGPPGYRAMGQAIPLSLFK